MAVLKGGESSGVRREQYPQNKIIFEEGESGGRAFVIEKGRVELSKAVNGEKRVLGTLGENEIFGELSVLTREPRSATAMALENTICLTVSEQEIRSRMKSADLFVQALVRILINSLKETTYRYVTIDQKQPETAMSEDG